MGGVAAGQSENRHALTAASSAAHEHNLRQHCTACRHQCGVIGGTIFEATKLGLSRWFLAMHLLTRSKNNVAALELMRHLGVLLGNLKRALSGTYHAFDFAKYAHRTLAEAQYRFNRRFNLSSILARLIRAAVLTSPNPASLIRVAEVGS